MANFDLSKRRRNTGAGALKLLAYSDDAITGKSSFGRVARLKFERPASTVRRPVALSSVRVTSAPSGSLRTISCSVTALTVVAPARSTLAGATSTTSISRSVARRLTWSPSASIRTLARIGMVLRRSTTDCAWATAFKRAARSIENFIASLRTCPGARDYPQRHRAQWFSPRKGIPECEGAAPLGRRRLSGFQQAPQEFEVVGNLAVLLAQFLDSPHPVHHRRMVPPPEPPADLRQTPRGELFGEIHGDLPGTREGAHPLRSDQVRQPDAVVVGYLSLDLLHGDLAIRGPQDVRQAILGEFQRDLVTDQRAEGEKPHQRTFKNPDVGRDPVCEKFEHAVGDLEILELARILFDLLLENAEPQLVVRRVKIGDQPRLQPAHDPVLDAGDLGGRAVRRDHHLLAGIYECVERVEELLLRGVLAGDELDVVDHQDIDRPEELLESHHVLVAQRLHEAVHELLGREVDDLRLRRLLLQLPGDGVHEMRLAEAHTAIKKQRVEGDRATFRHALGSGMGKLVGLADDEAIEAESGIERRAGRVVDIGLRNEFRDGRRRGLPWPAVGNRKLQPRYRRAVLHEFGEYLVAEIA